MKDVIKRVEIIEQTISEILSRLNTLINSSQENFDVVRLEDSKGKEDIFDNRSGLVETFENTLSNTEDITICREAIEELYEIILESED